MKLFRFGETGREKPAIESDGGLRKDVSSIVSDYDKAFFRIGGLSFLDSLPVSRLAAFPDVPSDVRIGPPVARPGKIMAIGKNYRAHAEEFDDSVPGEPILFMKAPTAFCGPFDDIVIPRGSEQTDWEVELGVVIGTDARHIETPNDSRRFIAGYCVVNDVSERDWQKNHFGQWTKGKSSDNFCPTGPYLIPANRVPDPQALELSLSVNGVVRQSSTTAKMIFSVDYLVWYLSKFMTLEAGDLIATGTPEGVGMGMKPPTFLKPGDIVEPRVQGLGRQRSVFVRDERAAR